MAGANVGVVIVTWNRRDDVLRLLASLEHVTYARRETVVVDNASTDDTVEAIRSRYPAVEIIVNCENLGGTGGFNTGIQHFLSKQHIEYLWLLDNDVVVSPEALGTLLSALVAAPHAAAAGSAMYDLTDRERLIEVGNFMSLPRGAIWGNQRFASPNMLADTFYEVDSVSACSMCVRVTAINEVGLWDKNFFLYFDDVDWNIRFRKHGHQIIAVPGSVIWHMPWEFKPGFNTVYYSSRNKLYLMTKHLKGFARGWVILREAGMLRQSLRALRTDPFRAFVILLAIEDFLQQRHGRYGGKDPGALVGDATQSPYCSWLSGLLRIAWYQVLWFWRSGRRWATRGIRSLAGLVFASFEDSARIRITRWLNGLIVRPD